MVNIFEVMLGQTLSHSVELCNFVVSYVCKLFNLLLLNVI
jgi:hypothetical protein